MFITHAASTPNAPFLAEDAFSVYDIAQTLLTSTDLRFNEAFLGCALTEYLGVMPLSRMVHERAGSIIQYGMASGMKALLHGMDALKARNLDSVAILGIESLSHVPHCLKEMRRGRPQGIGTLTDPILHDVLGKGFSLWAERMAAKYALSRAQLDAYVYDSYMRTLANLDQWERFLIPMGSYVYDTYFDQLHPDELASAPLLHDEAITAYHMAPWSDGGTLLQLSHRPLHVPIRVVGLVESEGLLDQAVRKFCDLHNWSLSSVAHLSCAEETAILPVHLQQSMPGLAPKINSWGGALVQGTALGASSLRLVAVLFHQMKQSGSARGIAVAYAGNNCSVAVGLERG